MVVCRPTKPSSTRTPDLSSFHGAAQPPRGAYELLRTSIELPLVPAPRPKPRRRLRTSGVGPNDIDIAQLQDTDSGSELIHMAETMLCKDGEQEALLHDGATEIGGRIPINTDGGLLANGEPVGASGSDRCSNSCISFAAPPGTGRCQQPEGGPRTALRGAGTAAVAILSR
ncbi:propanoyl-CoA C-acyltransferase domain protein [Mycobacterium xenopi 4042]|uniref:Propanoyl-CoA C-acyltransferase domain protein n=1 Tax=Mycobacterium xenopi 4042 TaxID=1299334 RepID=X8AGN3_MYCXE|nr:propanoyl-CoA C-acyltransferase domain protein [Mycobacterium xenopi 4042]